MAEATSWSDPQSRLQRNGYELRPDGGGVSLHDSAGTRLRKSSDLGLGYSRLVKRFAAPMPGHPHPMAHFLAKRAAEDTSDDRLVLIDPFGVD